MKRIVALVLVMASLAALVLSACSSGEKKSDQETLVIWAEKYFSEEANKLTEDRIKAFAEETGINVEYEFITQVDYITKLNAAIEAGNVPDVTVGATHKVINYYPENPYMDVTDLVQEINGERKIIDAMLQNAEIDGKYYYVPDKCSNYLLYARKDVFEEHGLEYPTTWEELVNAALEITDPEKGIYGFGMGCGPTDEDGEAVFRMMMWDNGGSLFDENENIQTEVDPATLEVVNWVKSMYENDAVPPGGTTWDPSGNNKSYLVGESAMVINAATLWSAMQSDESYKELFENTVALPVPGNVLNGMPYGWSIMKDAKNVEAAKSFIKYMLDPEWMDEFFATVAPVFAPVFEDCVDDELWTSDPVNKLAMGHVQKAYGYWGYPATSMEARALANKHYFTYPMAKMLNAVVTGSASPEDAILQMYSDLADIQKNMK